MRCAYLIPTANPPLASATFAHWRRMGWDTYALVDGEHRDARIENATGVFRWESYPGWGESFNAMARELDGKYDWLATGGDDVWPDFAMDASQIGEYLAKEFKGTFGVCQPAADRWAFDKNGTAPPLCYAPIIGREFAQRWNDGRGAFWPGYHSWFADNELYETANRARLLLVKGYMNFEHRHPAKNGRPSPPYKTSKHPRWRGDSDLYLTRKRDGFPGHEPIPGSLDRDRVSGGLPVLPAGAGG